MGWGLLKMGVIMVVCPDIELSYILSFRCDPGRGFSQQPLTPVFVRVGLILFCRILHIFEE